MPDVHNDLVSLHVCFVRFALLFLKAKSLLAALLAIDNLIGCDLTCTARFQELRSHKYLQSSLQLRRNHFLLIRALMHASFFFYICLASIVRELYNYCCPLTLSVYCRIYAHGLRVAMETDIWTA